MLSTLRWRTLRRLCIIWMIVLFCWMLLNILTLRHVQKSESVQQIRRKSQQQWSDIIKNEAQFVADIHLKVNNSDNDLEEYERKPLLTLFTTMKLSKDRQRIHNNTLRNWAYLAPYVTAVLYDETGSEYLKSEVQQYGWRYRAAPKLWQGLPVVKSMFQDAIATYTSDFYAYANADILFSDDLIQTLKIIKKKYLTKFPRGILLSGQRKNVLYTRLRSVHPNKMHKLRNKGRLFPPLAQDYFITTANGYPWYRVPDLVVGRPAWDNYLVIKSFQWRIPFIDTTKSITAFHQTGQDGNMAGFRHENYRINTELTGNFSCNIARTTCARYATAIDVFGEGLIVYSRPYLGEECAFKPDGKSDTPFYYFKNTSL